MGKEILSLRSIYQFLTVNDYPIYSTGIITKKNHTGLTLTRFWQENILVDYKNRKFGKQIWRSEGGRNRYTSEICNRSERFRNYAEYAEEIGMVTQTEVVLRQIVQFMNLLIDRQFDYNAFARKISAFVAMIAREDTVFSTDAKAYFVQALEEKDCLDMRDEEKRAFCCGWFITLFMLHALAGNGEGESVLQRIRSRKELTLQALAAKYFQEEDSTKKQAHYLTSKNTELCTTPLESKCFFGREEELFDLREMLKRGGKYLICGMGGIGKTELMRQFIRVCEEEALADYICTIQYERNMKESLVRAFPNIFGNNTEEKYKEALAMIGRHEKRDIVIFIDNMDQGLEEDGAMKDLQKLSASIFITSRRQKLDGFTSYEIRPLDKKSGSLVFRDNYKKHLSPEEKIALDEILESDLWRHTLTLRLLGHSIRAKNQSLLHLQTLLEKRDVNIRLGSQDAYDNLRQVYRQMYDISGIRKQMNRLLLVISLLPYQSFTLEFAQTFLRDFLPEESSMETCLDRLWETGWLEKSQSGYSMHPFMAECVRPDRVTEAEVAPFYQRLWTAWHRDDAVLRNVIEDWHFKYDNWNHVSEELIKASLALIAVAEKISGNICEEHLQMLLLAGRIQYNLYANAENHLDFWLSMRERCEKRSYVADAELDMLLCLCGYDSAEEFYTNFRQHIEKKQLSNAMLCAYGMVSFNILEVRNLEWAREVVEKVLELSISAENTLAAYFLLARVDLMKGELKGFEEKLLEGRKIGESHGLMNSYYGYQILCGLCTYYEGVYQFDKAEELLEEISKATKAGNSILMRCSELFYKGRLHLYREDPGYGVEELRKVAEWMKIYGVEGPEGYANCLGELAMACNKAGLREEAVIHYREALEIFQNNSEMDYYVLRILNNMSVVYLDWDKALEAKSCLEQALPIAEQHGGLALGEVQNNLARVCRMSGDREKEVLWLKKAIPILIEFYGEEHPKVVGAKGYLGEEKEDEKE